MNELANLKRDDGATLHLIKRDTKNEPYVVCWNFNGKDWDLGTYCLTLEKAQKVFSDKAVNFDFITNDNEYQSKFLSVDKAVENISEPSSDSNNITFQYSSMDNKKSQGEKSSIISQLNAKGANENGKSNSDIKPKGRSRENNDLC